MFGGGRGFRETKPFLPVVGFVYSVPSYIHVLLKTKNVTTGIKLLKNFFNLWCYYRSLILQWNPVNTATIGQKKSGRINRVAILTRVVLQENVWQFLPGSPKEAAVLTRWP